LYSSPGIIRMVGSRRIRLARAISTNGEKGNAWRVFGGKARRKEPLGRPRRMWQYIVKMDLSQI
jgi:hypothetical protein